MALAFAGHGADVVVSSRKADACAAVAAEVEALGRRALPVTCHVGHWDEVGALVETVYGELGRVDVLVNNAGMSPLAPSSQETTEELFDKVLGVNLKGPFRLTSLVGARMAQGHGGSIINVSSTGALMPQPAFGPYSASKAGLNALTQVFAREYGPSVRVNTISAGPFLTEIADHWAAEDRAHTRSAIGRPGRPDEIVSTALYLAGPGSSYVTGALIRVDGGLY
ncbi:glucose 1-dehydrogenase [soil metagenome]